MNRLRGNILLIGYGNPGRLDDGLGPAVAAAVEAMAWPQVSVTTGYQLAIENAEEVAQHDVVIFADADKTCAPPFRFEPLSPQMDATFSTHSMLPETILGLAHEVFGATTEGYLLGVRGTEFDDFGEFLSGQAEQNLEAAIRFLQTILPPLPVRQVSHERR